MRTLILSLLTLPLILAADFPAITLTDLKAAIAAKTVTVIDVNGTESFTAAHVDGAMDYEATGKDLASKLPADKSALVVAYCGGPSCGAWKEAATAATALGYTNVKHFPDGISGWKKAAEAPKVN